VNVRRYLNISIISLLVPLTLVAGVILLNDRKYYFISLILVIYAMIMFFLSFENRRPRLRELVVISVLIAIAVIGRAAFFMLPQFKPVVALVIIYGISLGAETGFLVGTMAALISNFFFGMGPFTPWQMFSLGLIGSLSGGLHKKGIVKETKLSLSIFGFLSAFLIYGGIMDLSSVLAWTSELTWRIVLATFVAGLPFNLMHSISTSIFLVLLKEPIMEKLERIKTKYGLIPH
jgi:energy-coupling factor transport system substrate-specific component